MKTRGFLNKKSFAAVILGLLVISFIIIAALGGKITGRYPLEYLMQDETDVAAEDFKVRAEDPRIVEISNLRLEDEKLKYDLQAKERGTTFLVLKNEKEGLEQLQKVYVHRLGIITLNTYFGRCRGGYSISLSLMIILALFYADRIVILVKETKKNQYSYGNIMNLGLIIFLTFMMIHFSRAVLRITALDIAIRYMLLSSESFSAVVLPGAFVIFVLISLSNLELMKKEGKNLRNMVGFFLGLGLCFLSFLPEIVYQFLRNNPVIDIFNEKGIATHLYSILEHSVFDIVAYLECVLAATVIFGIHAAKHVPAFDKDYIMILGCKIREDGSLTPLLKSRADKAVEFAGRQKEATGKEIIFVPSGGKGTDESISEAEAIENYLIDQGIAKEQILSEKQSQNTYENIGCSMKLIKEDFADKGHENEEPKVAYSTTNYHTLRAGILAGKQGYLLEGIGSPTKSYFWINAFIREFIATMVSEHKRHMKVFLGLMLGIAFMITFVYFSKQL